MNTKKPIGFWVLLISGIILLLELLLGQMMALINYDFTVSLGLQESVEKVTGVGVALNKGFGVADTAVYVPLLVLGLVGLWKRRFWGLFAMTGALAVTIYWPLVCMSMLFFAKGTPGFGFTQYTSYAIIMGLVELYGLWGLWYVYKNRKILLV